MSDRPILMSGPMVRALLEGRKTQTRRLAWREIAEDDENGALRVRYLPTIWQKVKVGDRLYVWEQITRSGGYAQYTADGTTSRHLWLSDWRRDPRRCTRWASRITLVVTEARMERVQEIGPDDAAAEGLWRGRARRHLFWLNVAECRLFDGRRHDAVFADLWEHLHGPGSWETNPEVVALTFTVHQCNIDEMEAAA